MIISKSKSQFIAKYNYKDFALLSLQRVAINGAIICRGFEPGLSRSRVRHSTAEPRHLHEIQRLQNRAAKIVTGNYEYVTTRGTELVRRLRWMCVTQRREYFMSILMYKSIHSMAPAYLCNEITLHSEIAERTTRSVNENNVLLPYAHLESFNNYYTDKGPIVWTSLPDYIKTCRTLHSFNAKMKLFIIN